MSELSTARSFHHGNLKAALAQTALSLIERSSVEALSIREVAREAGVSAAAPYRHYPNKDALLAEVARCGFDQLHDVLVDVADNTPTESTFLAQSLAYIRFAQRHPALYRLMFGGVQDKHRFEGLAAAGDRLFALLSRHVDRIPARSPSRAVGCWAFVHGLTMLTLDNQLVMHLPGSSDQDLTAVIRSLIEDAP